MSEQRLKRLPISSRALRLGPLPLPVLTEARQMLSMAHLDGHNGSKFRGHGYAMIIGDPPLGVSVGSGQTRRPKAANPANPANAAPCPPPAPYTQATLLRDNW